MGKIKLHKIDSNVARILATVSRITEVPISKIRGKLRTTEVVTARRICMVLINDKLNYSTTVNAAMDVDKPYQEFFNLCATAVGIKGMSDANDKDDLLARFAARVEHLEHENEDLKTKLIQILEIINHE